MSHPTPDHDGEDEDETLADELEERIEGMHEGEIADAEDVKDAFLSS